MCWTTGSQLFWHLGQFPFVWFSAFATMIWSASVLITRFAWWVTMITCRFAFAAMNRSTNSSMADFEFKFSLADQ
jgi:hypothetical protein